MTKNVIAMLHVRRISSLTPFYLLPQHRAVCTPKSQGKQKAPHCTYSFQACGIAMRDSSQWTAFCALPSVHRHGLCVTANSPWAPMRHLAEGLGVPHAEQMQGCGDEAAAGQDFQHPARILHFSLHPGALRGCSLNILILKQSYFKNINISRSKQDLGK